VVVVDSVVPPAVVVCWVVVELVCAVAIQTDNAITLTIPNNALIMI